MTNKLFKNLGFRILIITLGTTVVSNILVGSLYSIIYFNSILYSNQLPFFVHLQISIILATIVPLIIAPTLLYIHMNQAKRLEIANQKLANILRFDSLTKLLTRRAFFHDIKVSIKNIVADQSNPHAMLFLDLDHFKRVNDVFGHKTGDKVLSILGTILNNNLPTNAVCGRLGGEEFAMFIPSTNESSVDDLTKKITTTFKQQAMFVDGKPVSATLSIGVFISHEDQDAYTMLSKADAMLYRAKDRGRDQVQKSFSKRLAA